MNSGYFLAQDQAGNRQKVLVNRHATPHGGNHHAGAATGSVSYMLDDGSQVRRVDNETFQILDTGAYVTLVRE